MKMYRHEDYDQLKMEMPFGVTLREDNRWVILSKKFPWKEIDREYQEHFKSSEGQVAIPSRLAFGALYIQAEEGYTDEQTRRNIQENPYLQYFCGFECYTMDSPFDASMMTHFRKRISPEMIQRINDLVFATEAVATMDNPEEDDSVNQEDSEDPLSAQSTEESENRGTLILDATCCPADIHYPTDVGLLNHARELVEKMIDLLYTVDGIAVQHTLHLHLILPAHTLKQFRQLVELPHGFTVLHIGLANIPVQITNFAVHLIDLRGGRVRADGVQLREGISDISRRCRK